MNSDVQHDYLQRILKAQVYPAAIETPLEPAANLSRRLGNRVLLKREDLQPVFSFKIRGAYNKMMKLSAAERAQGLITASAGNHAQGVAFSAKALGCSALIVMPKTTPNIKVEAVRHFGAEVLLFGESFNEAYEQALILAEETGRIYVPPFDDPEIIAGQGTVGLELFRQYSDTIDAIFIPIGGGGLAAGVAVLMKTLKPSIKIIGVEPEDSCAMAQSMAAGERVMLADVGLFADGVAVKRVGEETFKLCHAYLDEVILVNNDAICAAIKDVFEDTRSICEPSGALAVAGLKAYVARENCHNQTLIAINSGANLNFDRLRYIAERSELGEQREGLFAVQIPEQAGSFLALCQSLGARNITEFSYRYNGAAVANIFVGLQMQGAEDKPHVMHTLAAASLSAHDLSDNELAKLHVRYLAGGHAKVADERIVRFEFPERPGALLRFLTAMQTTWSISLFHYRNHGADFGRVLVGIQVPAADEALFQDFLDQLAYPYCLEDSNVAAHLFFGASA